MFLFDLLVFFHSPEIGKSPKSHRIPKNQIRNPRSRIRVRLVLGWPPDFGFRSISNRLLFCLFSFIPHGLGSLSNHTEDLRFHNL